MIVLKGMLAIMIFRISFSIFAGPLKLYLENKSIGFEIMIITFEILFIEFLIFLFFHVDELCLIRS